MEIGLNHFTFSILFLSALIIYVIYLAKISKIEDLMIVFFMSAVLKTIELLDCGESWFWCITIAIIGGVCFIITTPYIERLNAKFKSNKRIAC